MFASDRCNNLDIKQTEKFMLLRVNTHTVLSLHHAFTAHMKMCFFKQFDVITRPSVVVYHSRVPEYQISLSRPRICSDDVFYLYNLYSSLQQQQQQKRKYE